MFEISQLVRRVVSAKKASGNSVSVKSMWVISGAGFTIKYLSKEGSSYSYYHGALKNGKADGKGRFFHEDYEYEGVFKDGKLIKLEKLKIPNDSILEGEFNILLQLNGKGRVTLPNGSVYDGIFKNGVLITKGEKKESRKILYIKSVDNSDKSAAISAKYGAENLTKIEVERYVKLPEIKDIICQRKDQKSSQVIICLNAHGNKAGKIKEEDEFFKILENLLRCIVDFNANCDESEKVKRVKFNIAICFGDKFVLQNEKFKNLILKFLENNIEVRTSAIEESVKASSILFDGKNPASFSSDKTVICERLFTFKEELSFAKKTKYYDLTFGKFGDEFFQFGGTKIYEKPQDFVDGKPKSPIAKSTDTIFKEDSLAR